MTDNEFESLVATASLIDLFEIQENIDRDKYPYRGNLIDKRILDIQKNNKREYENGVSVTKKSVLMATTAIVAIIILVGMVAIHTPDERHGFVTLISAKQKIIAATICIVISSAITAFAIANKKTKNKKEIKAIPALILVIVFPLYYTSMRTIPYVITINSTIKYAEGMILNYRGSIYRDESFKNCEQVVGVKIKDFPIFKEICLDRDQFKNIKMYSKATFSIKASRYGVMIDDIQIEENSEVNNNISFPMDSLINK